MSIFATVNGLPVISGRLMIPLVGMWTADLQLAGSMQVDGTATVVIGNLTLSGFVYRSEVYGGQTRVRLVAGAGGWRTVVQSQGYGSSSGVDVQHVLQDVALLVGEQVNVASAKVGNFFTRADAPASDVLWQLISQGLIPAWYVDPEGVTQTTAWPSSTITTPFTVTDQRPDEGVVVIATEDYASWMPGCMFSNPLLAQGVTYQSGGVQYVWDTDGIFRFEVLTGTADRFLGPLTSFVQKQLAPTRFYGRYAYTISNPSTTTVDATPVNESAGLPDLQNVPLMSDAVSTYTPPDGGGCHIMFLDGVPTQPICVWTDQTPTMTSILGGTNPVARLGDQVQCFLPLGLPFAGTSTAGPVTGTITAAAPISGVITQGSQTVNSQ
jgi:hypothetical protein